MNEDLISVVDLAGRLGRRKQTVFKIIKRLRIEPKKLRSSDRRGQSLSYVTTAESQLIADELRGNGDASSEDASGAVHSSTALLPEEQGVFYLLELEPQYDPGRFKVGFAVSLAERLRALRCSAPFARVVRTWPCKLLWEKTAIDCVTRGCQQVHTEVFRTASIEPVVQRCEEFFKLMPMLKDAE